jgi:glycosyltransferase involved in cell wall biosynthesis
MRGRQSGYIKKSKYFKYGKSISPETIPTIKLGRKQQSIIISQPMNERDNFRIFGKALPVVKPVVKPVTDETIKINQPFSLSRPIPKRIFFYWGGSDMSWMRYMTLYSFRKMNPDWEVILYVSDNSIKNKNWKTLENQDYYQYKGDNYFNKLKDLNIKIEKVKFPKEISNNIKNISPIHEGDLFRYYQLYLNGGFYCDMDVLFFKPIDNFFNTIINGGYDTIIHEYKSFSEYSLTVGFLGASVNNEYYKNLFEFGINKKNCEDNYQSMGVELIYSMFIETKNSNIIYDTIISKYPNLKFYNLPTELIYKYDWRGIKYCFTHSMGINNFNYNSIGYHWYGGGVESQKYNSILNEKNYKEHKTTFSTIADEVINMKVDNTGHVIFKNSEYPKVSIIMTSFNRPKLLNLGLSSIAKQKIDYPLEIVVVNDGIDDDTKNVCDSYKNKLNIKYIFSGHRNAKTLVSRSPAIPLNIGIKNSEGDIVILTCPEIYHLNDGINNIVRPLIENHNYLTIPEFIYFDDSGKYTDDLLKKLNGDLDKCDINKDDVQMPFLMGMWKDQVINIGGYDEDFIGYAAEDNDFVDRLKLNKCVYNKVDAKAVHLYHGKRCSGVAELNNPDWVYNNKLYTERKGILIRNVGKEWGSNIRISIVTAYYNRKKQFYETLKSIAKSKFTAFELIVVDDCSSPEHRLEEYLNEFSFLNIIRIEPENKWYVNPCIPFNIGIRAAIGDVIILQNPECLHVHDVLTYVNENINDSNYITMSAYSVDENITNMLPKYCDNNTLIDFLKTLPQQSPFAGSLNSWYNHSKYRPTYYHFCSAITKINMEKLNGFDERYAYGVAYDDDEFLKRIERLGLIKIINDNISVIHQYHPPFLYNIPNNGQIHEKNKLLYENITQKETKIKAN